MAKLSIEPRPPVNQGIDANNAMVLRHNAIYDAALAVITEGMQTAGLMINPYGTAPLSGYVGVWAQSDEPVRVQITNNIGAAPVDYSFAPQRGKNLIPLLGLLPGAINHITVTAPGINTAFANIITPPLPLTDAEIPPDPNIDYFIGFPKIELTVPPSDPPKTVDELYFCSIVGRYNVGIDFNGMVRWYTTLDIPSYSIEKLPNGLFITSQFDNYKTMYKFDAVGRMHAVYILDNECHHCIYALPNTNSVMVASETSGVTREDGVSVIDLNTGLETAYYNLRPVLDLNRKPLPATSEAADWLHINQVFLDKTNNLLIGSGRHQGVFAIDAATGELSFILASHADWGADFKPYLLTPVDSSGNPLYDFSNESDADKADKEFWCWGQHDCYVAGEPINGVIELVVIDNGNYRSRNEALALLPPDNYTRLVRYKINLSDRTVQKIFEYGKAEVGSRGYSSYVCNSQILNNGGYFVVFGGVIIDDNGRTCTIMPGITDIVDNLATDTVEGVIILQEVNPQTLAPQIEIVCTSGRYKNKETDGAYYRNAFYTFKTYKWPLMPL